jgi:signal transduction histidine kinase/phage shock protein PspC (stress-responsive transcriptional regulator)
MSSAARGRIDVQETRGSVMPSSLLQRSAVDRLVTGTAGGLGERLRVDPIVVRIGFVLLTLAGGLGLLLYGLGFVVSSEPEPDGAAPDAPRRVRTIATGAIVLGLLLVLRDLGVWFGDPIVVPATIAVMGSSVLGGHSDPAGRSGRRRWDSMTGVVRTIVGLVLVGLGTIWLVAAAGPFTISFGAVVLTAAVVAALVLGVGPFVLRAFRQATRERRERIRSEERAAVAAHLHDSVLQTLALIQRSESSPEIARLARRQERELRSWLYGRRIGLSYGRLGEALEAMAARVEEHHAVTVDVVAVGDCAMDDRLVAMVEACGEAALNAARHSGDSAVSVFVEVGPERVEAYVRDRGRGFSPQDVGTDRHGIANSIRARIDRAGGKTAISSRPGDGTEVHLWIPRGSA